MDRRHAIRNVALLVGGTLSAGTLAAILDGCNNNTSQQVTDHFTDEHKKAIAAMAEMIIPRTDTPGAQDAGVPDFVVMMMNECYSGDQRTHFIAGLNAFNQQCRDKYNKAFGDCDADQQKEMLTQLEKTVFSQSQKTDDKNLHFYRTFKELTLLGYFTSEPGATKALVYVPIPGKYIGCMPLQPGQKSWATS
jgi:glucoside 3-dehydrogenase (cytochrome c) hitch-hiker subunit